VVIDSVQAGKTAARAGLKATDVIIKLDGQPVSSTLDLATILAASPVRWPWQRAPWPWRFWQRCRWIRSALASEPYPRSGPVCGDAGMQRVDGSSG
jgi:hypothetical protein